MSLSVKQCGEESIRSIVTASASASECSEKFNCYCVLARDRDARLDGCRRGCRRRPFGAACSSTDHPRRGNGKSTTADRFGKAWKLSQNPLSSRLHVIVAWLEGRDYVMLGTGIGAQLTRPPNLLFMHIWRLLWALDFKISSPGRTKPAKRDFFYRVL